MPRAVLFDLDDTLNARAPSLERYARQLSAAFPSAVSEAELLTALARADRGGYNPERAQELAAAPVWVRAPDPDDLRDHWDAHWPSSVVEREGASELLQALRAAGFRTGLVTNGAGRGQRRKLERLGLAHLLDHCAISEEVGVAKPDPAIFRMSLAALGVSPVRALFVGDHPRNDVLGAADAGLFGVWLRGMHEWPGDRPPPAHAVGELREVRALAERLLG